MVLRPDEEASQSNIERDRNFKKNLNSGASSIISGAGFAAGSALGAKVLPFLNKYVPMELALKGINKVSPDLGKFLRRGQAAGLDIKEGMEFIKKGFEEKEKPKENRNIIEQYSPELSSFIDQEVKKGRSAIEAGAIAQHDKRFSSAITKMTKDHKTPWSSIVESVFGSAIPERQAKQQPQQNAPVQNQGVGPGQQALMDVLQKINQRLGQ